MDEKLLLQILFLKAGKPFNQNVKKINFYAFAIYKGRYYGCSATAWQPHRLCIYE